MIDKDYIKAISTVFSLVLSHHDRRAAMMGILGVFTQEVFTGQNLAEQFNSGHVSPFGDGQGFF